jgi:hypothetical protein
VRGDHGSDMPGHRAKYLIRAMAAAHPSDGSMATGRVIVELRCGVSGTPPEALLGCPTEFIDEVAGTRLRASTAGSPGSTTPCRRITIWRKVSKRTVGRADVGSGKSCVGCCSCRSSSSTGALDSRRAAGGVGPLQSRSGCYD